MGVSWSMPHPLQTQIAIRWSADSPSRPHHAMTAAPNGLQSPPRGIQLLSLYLKRFRRDTRRNNAKVRAFYRRDTPDKCENPTGGSWAKAHADQSSRGGGEWRHPPMALGWVALHGNLRLARGRSGLIFGGRIPTINPRGFASFFASRRISYAKAGLLYPVMRLFFTSRARNAAG